MNKVTPERISQLAKNEIFVFGSNTRGSHGSGAARQALAWGATIGQGIGRSGQTYAIPTMFDSPSGISSYVDDFIKYAKSHPSYNFLVTKIGCGIAGFTPEQIAPLFKEAISVDNIFLPKEFWFVLK